MLSLALLATTLLPSPAVRRATAAATPARTTAAAMHLREVTVERPDGLGSFGVDILRNDASASYYPPVVMVPPVGVGIDRKFYTKLLDEWERLGLPVELHALDLLGCGSSRPLPRRFYTPEVWAEQVLEYVQTSVGRPVVLMVQGGMAPVALETWRMGGGRPTIAGVIFMSPPPFQFFAMRTAAIAADYDEEQLALIPPRTRRWQRLFWLLAQSSVGGFAFRYLRGKRGERIREFSEANLFARAAAVDEKWVEQCVAAARPTRTRHATFSYLCGTIPDGGCWRDDRSEQLESLDVPCQVIRGDNVPDAAERLRAASDLLAMPSCCAVVKGARAVLPYEAPRATAELVARFMATNFEDGGGSRLSDAVRGRLWGGGKIVQPAENAQARRIGGLYELQ